jgi:WD40 repeat protein
MSSLTRSALVALVVGLVLPGASAAAQSPSPSVRMIPYASPGYHLRLSPDGTTAAVFIDPNLISNEVRPEYLPIDLIEVASGQQVARLRAFTDYASDVAFSPDGKRLASFHTNGQLNVWDATGSAARPVRTIDTTLLSPTSHIAFMPDGKTVVMMQGVPPGRFLFWDTGTGGIASIMGPTFRTYADYAALMQQGIMATGDYGYIAFAVSPDGTTLATATMNDEIALWSIPGGKPTTIRPASGQKLQLGIRQLVFSADSKSLLYVDPTDGHVHVWDIAKGAERLTLPVGGQAFGVSADWSSIAWATKTDTGTAIWLAGMTSDGQPQQVADIPLTLPTTMATLAFTPDGTELVVGGFASPSDESKNGIAVITLR